MSESLQLRSKCVRFQPRMCDEPCVTILRLNMLGKEELAIEMMF